MKNFYRKKNWALFLVMSTSLYLSANAFADAGPAPGRSVPVEVRSYGFSAYKDMMSQTKSLVSTMKDVYNNQVSLITDAVFPNLTLIGQIEQDFKNANIASSDIIAANTASQGFSNVNSANLIKYYLAGSYIRKTDALSGFANILNDNGEFNSARWEKTQFKSVLPSQISSQNTQIKIPTTILGSSDNSDLLTSMALNPDNFFSPTGYKTDQDLNNSKVFLAYIENNSEPPSVVKLLDSFDKMKAYYTNSKQTDRVVGLLSSKPQIKLTVPYSSDLTKKTSDIVLTKDQYDSAACDLGLVGGETCGSKSQLYQEYINSYRAGIVARMMYLSNLLNSYSARVPIGTGESLAQMQDDEANYRLKPAYLDKMKQAPAASIAIENLKLLAELHQDLHKLHQQNEKTNILLSLNGLQGLSFASAPGSPANVLGKFLYCKSQDPQPPECKEQQAMGAGSIPSAGAGLAPQTVPTK